ncbi:xanthine/uracil permease-like protein [Elsinoe australis]|uniref:Xanthine/uracil permease-like protein n=1 Tax=Elsinoe australis TaxID=40998 RepID=A0A4U7ALZ0_9PEZI|nr:xanthine/uracil permease-like protein [Elsinoe australis]
MAIKQRIDSLNLAAARSAVGRYFHLEGSGHTKEITGARLSTEIRAGLTTFFTMAYIIAVNAAILTDSGGTCVCNGGAEDPVCAINEECSLCLLGINRDLVTATAAIAALASFAMGLLANLPVAVAPAMGINAYFVYQLVGFHGSGNLSYQTALTAVFIEGLIFVAMSVLGIRQWLARTIPASIKVACGVGIGLFLTIVGLSYSAGIGAITGSPTTPLALGGCTVDQRDPDSGECLSGKAANPTLWIGFMLGCLLTAILMTFKIRGAIIFGILIVSIFSWPRDTAFTHFPRTVVGDSRFDFFKNVVSFRPIENTLAVQNWDLSGAGGQFALAIFTMLYVDILDCTGTLYSMARFSGVVDERTGDFPRSTIAYTTDAACITIGSLFGCAPVTAFVESGAGIQEGGKTGLTTMVTGICFFISLFFAPIFASIPPWATGGALILVGSMMMRGVIAINWKYPGDAIPAFITLMFMPFSYSIAYGLIAGLLSYTVINTTVWALKVVSRGRIQPPDFDAKEFWSLRYQDEDDSASWLSRALQGDRQFWRKKTIIETNGAEMDQKVEEQTADVERKA